MGEERLEVINYRGRDPSRARELMGYEVTTIVIEGALRYSNKLRWGLPVGNRISK